MAYDDDARMKRGEINLINLAGTCGFVIDTNKGPERSENGRCVVMQDRSGERILVKRLANGEWRWGHRGDEKMTNIFQFAIEKMGAADYKKAIPTLRPYLTCPPPSAEKRAFFHKTHEKTDGKQKKKFKSSLPSNPRSGCSALDSLARANRYLTVSRGLNAETLAHFAGGYSADKFGNAFFFHPGGPADKPWGELKGESWSNPGTSRNRNASGCPATITNGSQRQLKMTSGDN